MDPYEQKLLNLFRNFEVDGELNEHGLSNLCQTLQLRERFALLVKLLFKDGAKTGVSFEEFREGLLHVITSEDDETSAPTTAQVSPAKPSSDVESDREISPKFVVGTKKYGRRSRPTPNSDELINNDTSDSDNEKATSAAVVAAAAVPADKKQSSPTKVQRSASQSDVHGAKRRRPPYTSKLKRCASLPSQKASRLEVRLRQLRAEDSLDESEKMSALAQNLRAVWNSFEAGDVLDFRQLEVVCERVGLHKMAAQLAAEEVFEKLSITRDSGIHFADFLALIQSDSDMFSSVENIGQKSQASPPPTSASFIAKNTNDDYQVIEPHFSSGSIAVEDLLQLWTSAQVGDAEKILHTLGVTGKEVKLAELCQLLEEELQRPNASDTLLKASLALHKTEITSMRQSFRQLAEENRKLFADNREANRRASMLAQEVDERHSTLEDSTRTEIRSLEQRHAEAIRELSAQLTLEREHVSGLNARLELKIRTMEGEEQRLRQELTSVRDENVTLESEQEDLHRQITELLEQNIKLNQDIASMEAGGAGDDRADSHNEEMLDLIEKIETLQMENSNLRDKNDELQSDIESLNVEVMRWKSRSKTPREGELDQEASTSAAVKRRGDSPSKSKNIEESPRLGKVRKFSNDVLENESENTSGDWMALNSELATSTPAKPPAYHSSNKRDENEQMKRKILELEEQVAEYKSKLEADDTSTTAIEDDADALKRLKKENERLQTRVKEMEENLELMGKEYENCEDYWQSKLNEERLLFDEDQRQSDEKFAELLQKMTELEDQFASQLEQKNNGRLSPIDEKCQLESQYLELENEMEELKVHAQSLLDEKSREIEKLQLEVSQIHNQSAISARAPSPDNVSIASSPISYLLNQNTITGPIRDYQNPNYMSKKAKEEEVSTVIEEEIPPTRVISPIQKPQTSSSPQQQQQPEETPLELLEVNEALSMISNKSVVSNSIQSLNEINDGTTSPTSVTESQERLRKMKHVMEQMREEIQELTTQRESLIMELQQLQEAKPILANAYKSTHPSLSQKLEKLQMKNKHLQNVLRQQQQYTETIMYQTWHQQRQELNELRNRLEAQSIVISEQATRLAHADLLVKDLYVENSHLTATIQRMEQQIARQNLLQQFAAQSKSQLGSMSSITGMP